MTKTKHSLLMSAISLLLCFSMLIGTTFAWFTDTVTSSGNVIKSGTLDVTLEWMEGDKDPSDKDSANWKNAAEGAIFNSSLWEPGYTEVRHIKIENEGTLALKYVLNIIPYDENGKKITDVSTLDNLADVIDVYYLDPAVAIADRDDLSGITSIGTLREALAGLSATANGKLEATENHTVTLALKMRESAGNEYQNKKIGTDFAIQLLATQLDSELDSFDKYYDEDSKYPEASTASATIKANEDIEIIVKDVDDFMRSAKAVIPSEANKEEGAKSLTFVITPLTSAHEGITIQSNQGFKAYDVEIIGLHEDNDEPVDVTLNLEPELTGVKLYHFDDEITNAVYDEQTGILTFKTTSFSPYTVVYDAGWDGTTDTSWYNDTDTEFLLNKPEQLAGLAELVDDGNTFEGKTIKLGSDLNLYCVDANGETVSFDPIGYGYDVVFKGTFDGQGHTISNMYQNGWALGLDYSTEGGGLFASVVDATIKNVIIDKAEIVMECIDMGAVVGYSYGNCTYENIIVKNSTIANYNRYTGGVVGEVNGKQTFKNVDVIDTTVSALWGTYDASLGGIVGGKWGNAELTFEDCDVSAKLDAFNDACSNYQYYNYRLCGMLIGMSEEVTDGTATASYLTCKNCTVTYGDWVNYTYCESESYGKGSYAAADEWKFKRVQAGYATDGVDANHTHDTDESHEELLTFDQLFGGDKGVSGGKTHDGVTVIYPNN